MIFPFIISGKLNLNHRPSGFTGKGNLSCHKPMGPTSTPGIEEFY